VWKITSTPSTCRVVLYTKSGGRQRSSSSGQEIQKMIFSPSLTFKSLLIISSDWPYFLHTEPSNSTWKKWLPKLEINSVKSSLLDAVPLSVVWDGTMPFRCWTASALLPSFATLSNPGLWEQVCRCSLLYLPNGWIRAHNRVESFNDLKAPHLVFIYQFGAGYSHLD
jgi:hypothetical protein